MPQAEMRRVAMQAARSQLRRIGIKPVNATANDALDALDDLMRSEPDLIASQWYEKAGPGDVFLFRSDWLTWKRQEVFDLKAEETGGA